MFKKALLVKIVTFTPSGQSMNTSDLLSCLHKDFREYLWLTSHMSMLTLTDQTIDKSIISKTPFSGTCMVKDKLR